ncbi:23S rRNA (adenine(2503)-C(2))-methyltransferase RlmN [Desulforhopalus singaporensis]|uniref:Probable dual-specificity RNA methyltransferase RlmN n=1 Tax=Desulforhopalus singaporensis TaxID=91360 RepID=A0A1H0QJ34_9BACT|nr:23S rRNA (adenine(2503)-C(2))-methyltransferase RlmN [Desulforhopalus singaporensis]SDP17327.1 23S rRNA m(2)A-2503 methyltransferase [Desulforhopalus singaporensis]
MSERTKTDLRNFDQAGLVKFVESLGQPAFRGKQIMGWLYRPGISGFSEMTDLAKDFRRVLCEHACISEFLDPIVEKASDGCVKFGFTLDDGHIIESVLIPEPDRNTLCISSQVGCAMGCSFCLTGTMGFIRNLNPSEIVNQVCGVRDYLLATPKDQLIGPERVTNVVFMGMGEPLNNLENVLTSLSIMTEQKGLDLAARKITVSTCGIASKIKELGERSTVNLAISLHSVKNSVRSQIMPVNNRYPVEVLLETCKNFPMPKRKRIMFEYTLLAGINDSDEDAEMVARMLRGIPCKINLLGYNECPSLPYKSPDRGRLLAFQKILIDHHYTVFIRNSRGADISAACGQLATEQNLTAPGK